jgi:hypothetical protein
MQSRLTTLAIVRLIILLAGKPKRKARRFTRTQLRCSVTDGLTAMQRLKTTEEMVTMEMSENINELAAALAAAQGEMGAAVKDAANPFFKSKYADLGEVVRAVKQPFANNGLSYTQFPIREGESAGVVTMLMHTSGQYIRQGYTLPLAKFDAQATGSAITYARRYALQSIAGIPSADDDGNQATQSAPTGISDELAEHNRVAQECWSSVACIKQAIKDEQPGMSLQRLGRSLPMTRRKRCGLLHQRVVSSLPQSVRL